MSILPIESPFFWKHLGTYSTSEEAESEKSRIDEIMTPNDYKTKEGFKSFIEELKNEKKTDRERPLLKIFPSTPSFRYYLLKILFFGKSECVILYSVVLCLKMSINQHVNLVQAHYSTLAHSNNFE